MFFKTKITRFISAAAAAACLISGLNLSSVDFDIEAADAMTAFEITEDMQIGWNLGNSLDSTGGAGLNTETSWGNPKTTQAMIDAIKAKGFNTVRIPATWYPHLDGNNKIDDAWMARVKEVVDYCFKNDMYVILNLHHENFINVSKFTDDTLATAMTKTTAIWTQISEAFKDYDQHLVFEGMNEPRQQGNPAVSEWGNGSGDNGYTWNYVNTLNENFINIVRNQGSENNKNRLLMIPGYCASSDTTAIRNVNIPEDSGNVALSVHAYLPYFFTMANDSYANHEFPGKSGWGEDYEGALTQFFNNMDTLIDEKNAPVVIGEFSAANFNNTASRINWATYYITQAKKNGIPCMLWDNNADTNPKDPGEAHGYLNRNSCTWYSASEPVVDAMMTVIADDSIKWGDSSAPTTEHDDMSTGVYIIEKPQDIDGALTDGNCTTPIDITWAQIEGGDIAVKYTGDTPVIAFTDSAWDGWKEIISYDIDKKQGIAYFSSEQIAKAWGEDKTDTIAKFFVKTTGKTTVEAVAIIGGSGAVIDPPVDTTKKYSLDLSARAGKEILLLEFEGAAGSTINGCVGFMGDEWTTIDWDGVIPASGKFTTTINLSDIPETVTSAEAQIWWCDDADAELVSYKLVPKEVPVQPTTAPASVQPSETVYGDANLDNNVDVADAVLILQYLGNPDAFKLEPQGMINADSIDNGGGITGMDSLAILAIDAKLFTKASLPMTEAQLSEYTK